MSRSVPDPCHDAACEALAQVPHGRFLLTAAAGDVRAGLLVDWVSPCGSSPPSIMLALPKGQPISPLIRDSRHFGLALIRGVDPLVERLFASRQESDVFLGLTFHLGPHGSPILDRGEWALECELMRHLDIESDCELYVGIVRSIERSPQPPRPASRVARTDEPRAAVKVDEPRRSTMPNPRRSDR